MPQFDILAAGWGLTTGAYLMRLSFFTAARRTLELNDQLREKVEKDCHTTLNDGEWRALTQTGDWNRFRHSLAYPICSEKLFARCADGIKQFLRCGKTFGGPALTFWAGVFLAGATVDLSISKYLDAEDSWELYVVPTTALLFLTKLWFIWRLMPHNIDLEHVKTSRPVRNIIRAIKSGPPVRAGHDRSERAAMTLQRRRSDIHSSRPATHPSRRGLSLRAILPRVMALRAR